MQKRLNDVITDLHEICETLHFWAIKLKSFKSFEGVSRYCDSQLQVTENYLVIA